MNVRVDPTIELSAVEAELNYLAPMAERPRYYAYEPEPGEPRSNLAPEPHRMQIHTLRPIADELDLGSGSEDGPEPGADERLVVADQDPGRRSVDADARSPEYVENTDWY